MIVDAVSVELMICVLAVMVLPDRVENASVLIFMVDAVRVELMVIVFAVIVLPVSEE